MENGDNNINTKAYYESVIEELKTRDKPKFKLTSIEIEELSNSITDSLYDNFELIDRDNSYNIVFNRIHEKYGI